MKTEVNLFWGDKGLNLKIKGAKGDNSMLSVNDTIGYSGIFSTIKLFNCFELLPVYENGSIYNVI